MKATNVSVTGDRKYTRALGILAYMQDNQIASLVRKALDAMYGEEIEAIMNDPLFFADGVAEIEQPSKINNGGDE